jgi:hypothetical protein
MSYPATSKESVQATSCRNRITEAWFLMKSVSIPILVLEVIELLLIVAIEIVCILENGGVKKCEFVVYGLLFFCAVVSY